MRVLSRNQEAVGDDMSPPVGRLREDRAELQHLIFHKEGHNLGEANLFFLTVGEARNFLALDQKLAIRRLDVTQRTCGMAHDANWLAGGKE